MKRTTLWVTLAATGVQLAALGLCAWAMQNSRNGSRALAKPRADDALRLEADVLPHDVVVVPEPALAVEPAVVEAPIAPLAPEPVVAVASGVVDEPSEALAPNSSLAAEPPLEHAVEPDAAQAGVREPSAAEPAVIPPAEPELEADRWVSVPESSGDAVPEMLAVDPSDHVGQTPAMNVPAIDTVPDIWADPATLPEFWSASGSLATTSPDSMETASLDSTAAASPQSVTGAPHESVANESPDPAAAASPPAWVAVAPSTHGEAPAAWSDMAGPADAAPSPSPSPRYAPPRAIPRFITNFVDAHTQIVVAEEGEPPVVFGLFADGNIRCVDVDNGCYGGKAEGQRSRMREVAGSRAFTVHLEPADDGSFTASFIGGLHDAQTMTLLPVGAADRA